MSFSYLKVRGGCHITCLDTRLLRAYSRFSYSLSQERLPDEGFRTFLNSRQPLRKEIAPWTSSER